jgi:hypothetical protein
MPSSSLQAQRSSTPQPARRMLCAAIPLTERRRLHGLVAELGGHAGIGSDVHASEHFELAGRPAEAHGAALVGARAAAGISAHREAMELYRRAVRTLPADSTPAERGRILRRREGVGATRPRRPRRRCSPHTRHTRTRAIAWRPPAWWPPSRPSGTSSARLRDGRPTAGTGDRQPRGQRRGRGRVRRDSGGVGGAAPGRSTDPQPTSTQAVRSRSPADGDMETGSTRRPRWLHSSRSTAGTRSQTA